MKRFTVSDSINLGSRRVRSWLSCCSILGMLCFAGCDVNVEDDPDVIEIEEPDTPDVEIDGPDVNVD